MPYGVRPRGSSAGPSITPRLYIPPGTPDAPAREGDTWQHISIPTGALAPAGTVVDFTVTRSSRLKVLVIDPTRLLLRLNDLVDSVVTKYDLYHPGAGELDESVPPFERLTVVALGALAYTVEIWCLGGIYAERPS